MRVESIMGKVIRRGYAGQLVLDAVASAALSGIPERISAQDSALRTAHATTDLMGQCALLRLHFVVFENDCYRIFALPVNISRFFHDNEIVIGDGGRVPQD